MALALTTFDLNRLIKDYTAQIFNKSTKGRQIDNLINQLKDREEKMLSQKFGVNMTRSQLKKNLRSVKENAQKLSLLTGTGMRQIITLFNAQIGEKDAKEQLAFQTMLNEEWEKWGNNLTEEQRNNGIENEIEKFILSLVAKTYENFETVKIGGKKHSGKVYSLPNLRKEDVTLDKLFLNDLAEVTQKRIRIYMKEHNYKVNRTTSKSYVDKIKDNTLSVAPPFDWYSYTHGLTATEAKSLPIEEIISINKQFKEDFLNVFGSINVPLKEILDYVIPDDSLTIFTGKSDTQITGLCGEIQALCYLALLIGKDNFNIGKASKGDIEWSAKTLYGGKQAHADIMLGHYGIQVKNSTKNLIDKIDFVDSRFETFLLNLYNQNVISYELSQDILNIYEAYYFNVPYKMTYTKDSSSAIPTSEVAEKFKPYYEKINRLHAMIEGILNQLVGQLMYIGVGRATKDNNASNIIFFIGGEILFSSEILENVLEKIGEVENSFQLDVSNNSSFTIIDAINENGKKIFNYPGITTFYDQMIKDNIWIKSSYDFSSLL